MKKGTVFVGMSGGVDSSVAAYLLKRQGYHAVGVFLRCYNIDGCAERDAEDARRVAEHIGIPFYVWDFEQEYKERVVEYMIEGYRAGLTPNPDVACNREVKFGLFLDRALQLGADYVATGHYARMKNKSLLVARDGNKDQSYFLWAVPKGKIAKCLFPIGDYVKPQVRAIARKAGLPTAEKKDSQGICFLGKFSVADFLKRHIPARRGVVVTTEGRVVGEHDGAWFYTIGQRHIGTKYQVGESQRGKNIQRQYVAAKDAKTNTLVVAEGPEHAALYRKEVRLANMNLFISKPKKPIAVYARVRYRQPVSQAKFVARKGGGLLAFARPQKFVAEGQSAVFYDAEGRMLGGGVIVA